MVKGMGAHVRQEEAGIAGFVQPEKEKVKGVLLSSTA